MTEEKWKIEFTKDELEIMIEVLNDADNIYPLQGEYLELSEHLNAEYESRKQE